MVMNDFANVWDEATRDYEAEGRERQHTAATLEATETCWAFIAQAKSESEFNHRLALVEDRLTSIASKHGVEVEEVTGPLRAGFLAALPRRVAAHPLSDGTLNDAMDFEHPVRIDESGRATDAPQQHVPYAEHSDEHDMLLDGIPHKEHPDWEALTGHTGQHGYNGPVMHSSEYIGGGLEDHIRSHPGTYATQVVEVPGHAEEGHEDYDSPPAGWTILRKREGHTASKTAAKGINNEDDWAAYMADQDAPAAFKGWQRCDYCGQTGHDDTAHKGEPGYDSQTRTDAGGTHYVSSKTAANGCSKCDPHNIMPPGSVTIRHRPDKSGRYDVNQINGPMSMYTVHQGYDADEAMLQAQKAHSEAVTRGQNSDDPHANGGHAHLYDYRQPMESKQASFDQRYAFLKKALEDGVDPLALITQMNGGSPSTEVQHDQAPQLTGGGSALDAAMSDQGTSMPSSPSGHQQTEVGMGGGAAVDKATQVGGNGGGGSRHEEAPVLTNQSEIPPGKTAGRVGDDDWYDRNDDYRREGEADDRAEAEDSDDPDTDEREAEYKDATGGGNPFR